MNPNIGAPIGPDIPEGRGLKTFDHVPQLHELLPNGGWPGVVYAQVCIHNLKAAADREERPDHLRPIRGSTYYTISGPRGMADMALVGRGQPIPGAAPEAGARLFFTDGEVRQQTGFPVEHPIWFSRPVEEDDGEIHVETGRQGREGHARVQARHAAQWEPEGTEGDLAQASGGDRAFGGAEKSKRNLKGHTHPPNFGRIVSDCGGCDKVLARRTKHQVSGLLRRNAE